MTDNLKTLNTFREGAVLFAEIPAPPTNLLGPELVRDLVSLIQRATYSRFVSPIIGLVWVVAVSRVLLARSPATRPAW
jgi:hypothetical protein